MNTPSNFVAYYRVSTQKQGQSGLGLEAQKATVLDYLTNTGGVLLNEFEEVESGKKTDRPQLAAALNYCQLTGATLIIAKLDRLARNVSFLFQLMDSHVKFVACDCAQMDNFSIGIIAMIAQRERELISERTKKALAAKKARGEKLGGYREGGFGDEATRAATVAKAAKARTEKADEYALKVAGHIRQAQHSGLSLRQIAQVLNDKGISTARGKKWQAATVRNMIARLDALAA